MTISLAFLAPKLVQAAVDGRLPVASASQICGMRRPNGPGNTPGSGSRFLIRHHGPGTEVFRLETKPKFRPISPSRDQMSLGCPTRAKSIRRIFRMRLCVRGPFASPNP